MTQGLCRAGQLLQDLTHCLCRIITFEMAVRAESLVGRGQGELSRNHKGRHIK